MLRGAVPSGDTTTGHSSTRLSVRSPEVADDQGGQPASAIQEQQFVIKSGHQFRI